MKALSPLIASILLIAFTVAVGGIIATWITGFTKTQTETVTSQAETDIICSYGGISLSSLSYCNNYMSGRITNTGSIALGKLKLQVMFSNATDLKIDLCSSGSSVVSCSSANLSLGAREQTSFNISIGNSNYNSLRIITNCSAKYDEATSSEISAC